MKTSLLHQLSKEITQGEWILKNHKQTGMALIEDSKGGDIAICDEGFPQHNAQAISLTPQLIKEVLELRECIENFRRLEVVKTPAGIDSDFWEQPFQQARSLLTRHETTN